MATELWKFQRGTAEDEHLHGCVVGSNGTYVFAGHSEGVWNGTNAGGNDFVVFKVDAKGDIIWIWQDGTGGDEVCWDIVATDDESVVMIGGRDENTDFYCVKLDADGGVVWEWEEGTTGEHQMLAIAADDDDSTIFAGRTSGDWSGVNGGGWDFAASKLDVNGNELWKWQDGTPSSDFFSAAAVAGDGSVILAGASSGSWGGLNRGGQDFAAVKIDSDGKEIWRWQDGTEYDDDINGVAIGNDASVLLTGSTLGNWSEETAGSWDFVACKLDANGTELWRWQVNMSHEK